ncbi:Rieske (2Fe-2S) protein [Thermoplasmatales archaeon AK]|nr:Rieske (2Fe-2S) protein [Thermoplasmatales archaeon AK]
MAWKKLVSVKALEHAGGHFAISTGSKTIFIARGKDGFHAMDAVCSHAKCILGIYNPSDETVKCYCHDAKFDLKTGKMITPPSVAQNAPMDKLSLSLYNVRENQGFLEVDID